MKRPELLLPAGNLAKMRAAYDFGADAVYAGQPRYSLRARNNDFQLDSLSQGISYAHERGKLFYVASNLLPHNSKVKTYMSDMQPVIQMAPDALIMADPGLIMMVRERWPHIPIHLSVQANTVNYMGVKFWQKMGISRIILSRELSLDEIKEIRQECPDIELEVFVHGALCIAYSGRCLLSGYFNHRDSNQGTCTNACRWDYLLHDTQNNEIGDVTKACCGGAERRSEAGKTFLLEEPGRSGELMPIIEDEHGTYIMNSKDLRAVEQVEKLVKIGIDSLKIEGRTKSLYYVARAAQTYRTAIDDALSGRKFNVKLLSDLEGLANRGYTSGFLERHQTQDYQNYLTGNSMDRSSKYVGLVVDIDEQGWALVDVKNHFEVGDLLEIIHPSGNRIERLINMQNDKKQEIKIASGSGIFVRIPNMQGMSNALIANIYTDA